MPEFEMPEISGTPAEQAVHYVLARIPRDANFAYYLFGTETLARCLQAEAARTGSTRVAVEAALNAENEKWRAWRMRRGAEIPEVIKLCKVLEDAAVRIESLLHGEVTGAAGIILKDLQRELREAT